MAGWWTSHGEYHDENLRKLVHTSQLSEVRGWRELRSTAFELVVRLGLFLLYSPAFYAQLG